MIGRHKYAADMVKAAKTMQLQIRLTRAEKAAMQRAARGAGMGLSAYVLSRVYSPPAEQFAHCLADCRELESSRLALAELHALLSNLTRGELSEAVKMPPPAGMNHELENYVAAMVEQACANANIAAPRWAAAVIPLAEPVFGSALRSIRLYLLTQSPPAFRRRNLFIDATLGAQV